jgi:hypothetical protein
VLDLGVLEQAAEVDRGERPDVGVAQDRVAADDGRPAHDGALDDRALLDDDAADERAVGSTVPATTGSTDSSTLRLHSSMSSSRRCPSSSP